MSPLANGHIVFQFPKNISVFADIKNLHLKNKRLCLLLFCSPALLKPAAWTQEGKEKEKGRVWMCRQTRGVTLLSNLLSISLTSAGRSIRLQHMKNELALYSLCIKILIRFNYSLIEGARMMFQSFMARFNPNMSIASNLLKLRFC